MGLSIIKDLRWGVWLGVPYGLPESLPLRTALLQTRFEFLGEGTLWPLSLLWEVTAWGRRWLPWQARGTQLAAGWSWAPEWALAVTAPLLHFLRHRDTGEGLRAGSRCPASQVRGTTSPLTRAPWGGSMALCKEPGLWHPTALESNSNLCKAQPFWATATASMKQGPSTSAQDCFKHSAWGPHDQPTWHPGLILLRTCNAQELESSLQNLGNGCYSRAFSMLQVLQWKLINNRISLFRDKNVEWGCF